MPKIINSCILYLHEKLRVHVCLVEKLLIHSNKYFMLCNFMPTA